MSNPFAYSGNTNQPQQPAPQQIPGTPPQFGAANVYTGQVAPTQSDTSVGQWMLTLFLAALPVIGIIMMFVWAFGSNASPAKANWAKATLLWAAISIGISIVPGHCVWRHYRSHHGQHGR